MMINRKILGKRRIKKQFRAKPIEAREKKFLVTISYRYKNPNEKVFAVIDGVRKRIPAWKLIQIREAEKRKREKEARRMVQRPGIAKGPNAPPKRVVLVSGGLVGLGKR